MHDVGDKIHIVVLMFELAAPAVARELFVGCCRHGKAAGLRLIMEKNRYAFRITDPNILCCRITYPTEQ